MSSRLLLWLYFVLSFSDYLFTTLLCHLTACNIEGNPLAGFVIKNFGLVGLAVYKVMWVCIVLCLLTILNYYERGKKYIIPLLIFACSTLLVTVGYSGFLMITEIRI